MQRLIRTLWRAQVGAHRGLESHPRPHKASLPGPAAAGQVKHGYRLCDARGKELKAQAASPQYSGQEGHGVSVDARNVSEALQGRDEVGEDCALSGRH